MSSTVPPDLPRSATRHGDQQQAESRPLSDWSGEDAYILLGEPGAGKSCAFRLEAERDESGLLITARDFANGALAAVHAGQVLFIDGLDEMRAGSGDRDGALDRVIQQLLKLGKPRFRLSCREADWFAALDQDALRVAAPGGHLSALHLDPLDERQVLELLGRHPAWAADPEGFVRQATARGVAPLLRNPLMLDLLAKAVGPEWPRGRAGVYRLACERLATEHNPAIRAATATTTPLLDSLLDDAGILCAVLLLSGREAFVHGPVPDEARDIQVESLPASLRLAVHQKALASRLFIADGERRLTRHRTVAEYLAARAIGRRVTEKGLPLSRVAALIGGQDGGTVEPLRGLHAWLSVTCPLERPALIDSDPLACVLYGDVREFSLDDKRRVLRAFQRESERFVWFRAGHWESHPYGALGTADMVGEFGQWLADPRRDPEHQAVLDSVLDAIRHGEPMPALLPALEAVFRDASYNEEIRSSALDAWIAQPSADLPKACGWLEEIREGQIDDPRDELCGRLLKALYPDHLQANVAVEHLHEPKVELHIGSYLRFWSEWFLERTPSFDLPVVADALASTTRLRCGARHDRVMRKLLGRVLPAALNAINEPLEVARIWNWLGAGVNEFGQAELRGNDALGVRIWFEQEPMRQKAVVSYGYSQVAPDSTSGAVPYWMAEQRLFGAARPDDWCRWLLVLGAQTIDPSLARYCFKCAADHVLTSADEDGLSMLDMEQWVQTNRVRWPEADQWLESDWSMPLECWQREHHLHEQSNRALWAERAAARRADVLPMLSSVESGNAASGLMYELTLAYRDGLGDIEGETPEGRVAAYLGVDPGEAHRAIAGIRRTLQRTDLPTADEILDCPS